MRLDRLVGQLTGLGRSAVRREIAEGKVSVDEKIERDSVRQVGAFDVVSMGDEILQNRIARYVILNKPVGILSATTDPEHQTVISLINEPWAEELHLAGRLDRATTGLVILTNDSSFSESLTQPTAHIPKTYLVTLDQAVPPEALSAFRKGIPFEKEGITTQPAITELMAEKVVRLSIYEGMHHQVKRMFAKFDIRVTDLHRESIGPYHLTPDLPAGAYSTFTPIDAC
jgi:16S rRNA pseudouridine516 synthase